MIFGLLLSVSCTKYDEVAMWNKGEDMDSRLAALEELCSQMNTNINSLRLIVEALQDNDYVTGVVPVVENGETVGYTITFVKSGSVTIYHGADGRHGTTPTIGVRQDTDGIYYWTLNGEWLTGDQGERVMAQGMAGKSAYELAVENGYRGTLTEWLASLNGDNGDDGKSAYELAVENGYRGTEEEWLASLKGNTGCNGKSAYELAVENGYQGTLAEWLASLNGNNGNDGKSAYELAVENGYRGTEEEWLASLKGNTGDKGDDGITPKLEIRKDGYWYVSYDGEQTWTQLGQATGDPGQKGDSMFSDIDNTDPDYFILELAEGGEQIKLPRYKDKFDLLFVSATDNKVKEMTAYCGAGATVEISYELTNPLNAQISIECISHSGYRVTIDKTDEKIHISAPDDPAAVSTPESEILVFASDDERTIMRKLIVKQVKYITYKATRPLDWGEKDDPRFWGKDVEFIDGQSSYDPDTGQGKWAYTGTVIYVTDAAFSRETSLQEITIPASITEIGRNLWNETGGGSAFENCTALTNVVFEGDNMSQINKNTFNGCKALVSINLPKSLKIIDYNAFLCCSSLEEITIPDAVIEIGDAAFSQCSKLKTVILGTQLEKISYHAFNECLALETVLCPDETPATLGEEAFPLTDGWGYEAKYRIYVPDDVVDLYKTTWPKYWDSSNPWKTTKVIYGISSMPAK